MQTVLRTALTTVALLFTLASDAAAQDERARFEITAPTDTSFMIVLGNLRWVRSGMVGIVVDPRQRDELVARYRIEAVGERYALATITGTTTSVTVFHAALLVPPKKRWYQHTYFWIGAVLGAAIGFAAGSG